MELPNSEYNTIKMAYDYIKKTYPHLTDGFHLREKLINSFRNDYPAPIFSWSDDMSFLGWGFVGDIRIPFPDADCIVLGEII